MLTTIFALAAFVSLLALLCMHPLRAKAFAPRLIAFLAFSAAFGGGLFILSNAYDLYSAGRVPSISWRGSDHLISADPTYAAISISVQIVVGIVLLACGIYMFKIALQRRKSVS